MTPDTGASDPDSYYYKTLKFTATSSDSTRRTIQMKTYPAKTCPNQQYTTGSTVVINEGTETTYSSLCGTKSKALHASSLAALDTFINGTKVYSFSPYVSNPREEFAGLDGKTVETDDFSVKFVKDSSSTDPNEGKTYYVVVSNVITPQLSGDERGGDYFYSFVFSGQLTMPDVSNDTFFSENEITLVAQPHATADVSCGVSENHRLGVYTQPRWSRISKINAGQNVPLYDLDNSDPDATNRFSSSNANCTIEQSALDKSGSKYWVDFGSPQADDDTLSFTKCKTLTKNGSSRTICVKYSDEQHYCSDWKLKSENSYCSYSGESFKCTISPDATHPEDDFQNKCGEQNSVAFSFSSKHCPVWSDSGSSKCSYYPNGYTTKPGFKTENRLLNNYIILWLNNNGKIEFAVENYGNRRLVPAKQEYVVMATIKLSTEDVDDLGERIDSRRKFYQLFIDQTINNKTCYMYMNPYTSLNVDVSRNNWNEYEKLTSGSSRTCAQLLQGNETSNSGTGFLTSSTATSSVGKWFKGKTINDFADKSKWEKMISSGGGYFAYIWYRITPNVTLTKTNTVEEFTVYPGCTRDVAAPMGQCFYGWAEHGAHDDGYRCSRFCPDLPNVYMFK